MSSINAIAAKYGFDHFDLMIDWGWFRPLTKGMFYLLSFVHGLVGNFGIAILLVTVLVKAAVFPLASKSYASMSKMKKLKPQMDAIKGRASYLGERALGHVDPGSRSIALMIAAVCDSLRTAH